ncbi:MAG TPA: hypothetical protein DE045_00355 [Oceanospirillaceae bacterium]|nr:hypothetical protein [Oceanospirillaceae bacterium]
MKTLLTFWASLWFCCAGAAYADTPPITTFVQQLFPHGVPQAQASNYSSADTAVLLTLLADSKQQDLHANILETLGYIGDETTVAPIVAYIQGGRGVISAAQFRAKSSGLLALGYILNRNPNSSALLYLTDSLDHQTWQARDIAWTTAFFPDLISRDVQLVRQAAVGMTLSGSPQAAAALKRKLSPQVSDNPDLQPASNSMLDEMLKANQTINAHGLDNYQSTLSGDSLKLKPVE